MQSFSNVRVAIRVALALMAGGSAAALVGCGSSDDNSDQAPQQAPQSTLVCDDSMKTAFAPDASTTVTMVKSFKKGEPLLLTGAATPTTPTASNDVCVVKLNVGPGNTGPADAPSTSPGIGIEVWLPAPANWNNRLHLKGGGGWAGTAERSTTTLVGTSSGSSGSVATTAMVEGAVSASTDTGHTGTVPGRDASWAMNPDGTINTALWRDFSERAIHEMAVKTKALAKSYYGRDARYSYFNGFSTGGRQGMKEAQANPADFDGILAGAPAFNWTKFITAELYPQIVYQRDLGGVNLTAGQLSLMSNAAIDACGTVGGVKLGYIPDPSQCTYDPRKDANVLCNGQAGVGITGANTTANCVNLTQATAMNKIWYGQTVDGSVPDPAADNGWSITPSGSQKWYGLTRGTDLNAGLGGATQFPIASEMVALELQNPLLASNLFRNATGNGADRWKSLTYAELANASDRGVALQPQFANINTDNPDLSAFRNRGGKLLSYHGLADTLIMPQGTVNYYNRVAAQMGGIPAIQSFYRFYLVPGMAHGFANGTSNPTANPPLPTNDQLYRLLTDWVENGTAPGTITATAPATATLGQKSRPLCLYPQKATYTSGDPNVASSYTCS
ncbi:tannase/feruloyl esterase family alpha/beta hydrolase [Noviherbaspirillum sp. CPCC 100848]|uniref:Tannase/feruloyl esterase family alpha/beta hydrolase n=1 Tax=Noviherbaspirillum album TaxID=3080276 RepID=A0ABU6JC60_9BURK|nr:tannase/feruloyl esterase family alpha/beta hydrolase [Noviherbaspirillum sp. CPCC 100848]MEC4720837.1 tannase/feruloyl esterase family alpha/beta hydrolase [Noviherbaspirillum sp. CPCC 100848]